MTHQELLSAALKHVEKRVVAGAWNIDTFTVGVMHVPEGERLVVAIARAGWQGKPARRSDCQLLDDTDPAEQLDRMYRELGT